MPEWSEPKLQAHLEKLKVQAAETKERRAKAALLGRVEAAFWRRKEEVPIATASLSVEKLQELLDSMEGRAGGAKTKAAADAD